MSFVRSPATVVWLLAAAYGVGAAWAGNWQTGKLHPWVLIAMFWGAALLSVLSHYLLQYLAEGAAWTRRSWLRHAPVRARLLKRARLGVTQASVWARRSWHRHATQCLMLLGGARLALGRTGNALVRSARHLARGNAALASAGTLAGQGWETAQRAWEQQMAGARRAPGALIGWSRSALKALRT